MGMKLEDGTLQDICLDKLRPGERFFVLREQDKLSPELIREWARMAEIVTPLIADAKINEALELAQEMEACPYAKYPD